MHIDKLMKLHSKTGSQEVCSLPYGDRKLGYEYYCEELFAQSNEIYVNNTNNKENLYEEPQESRVREDGMEPKEKNVGVFYKLSASENTDITSTPHEEEYDDMNYEAIEERETAL